MVFNHLKCIGCIRRCALTIFAFIIDNLNDGEEEEEEEPALYSIAQLHPSSSSSFLYI